MRTAGSSSREMDWRRGLLGLHGAQLRGAFQKVAASCLRALPSALLPHPWSWAFLAPLFLVCSSKTKERLTEFSEGETRRKKRAWSRTQGETRYRVLNPHLAPTDTVSHSLVPPTTLSSHILVEMERHRLAGRQRVSEVLGVGGERRAGPWCFSNRKLAHQKRPISFLHTSKYLGEDTEPWGLGLTQAREGGVNGRRIRKKPGFPVPVPLLPAVPCLRKQHRSHE